MYARKHVNIRPGMEENLNIVSALKELHVKEPVVTHNNDFSLEKQKLQNFY